MCQFSEFQNVFTWPFKAYGNATCCRDEQSPLGGVIALYVRRIESRMGSTCGLSRSACIEAAKAGPVFGGKFALIPFECKLFSS